MTSVDPQKEFRYSQQILAFRDILQKFEWSEPLQRILVLGCGNGLEAGYMHHLMGAQVYGIDIEKDFHPWGQKNATLSNYDGGRLPFHDGFFDAVYSYHVLEHVKDVPFVLSEVRRVVRPNGVVYVGVPNKSRLIGYMGMNDKSMYRKLRQNIKDLLKRIKGEWDNALGAHAGFREDELSGLLGEQFTRVVPVTKYYYSAKWSKYDRLLRWIEKLSLDKIVVPSVYVLASD